MTYKEAEKRLSEMGASQLENGDIFINRISPKKEKEDIKFIATLRERSVSEDEMKSFSSDNQFKVRSFKKIAYPNV
jgi:hypothetical protein